MPTPARIAKAAEGCPCPFPLGTASPEPAAKPSREYAAAERPRPRVGLGAAGALLRAAGALPRQQQRAQATEQVGQHVTVKKHSSMGIAVISLREPRIREALLATLGDAVTVAGKSVQLKPHFDKETKEEVMTDIFAAWGRQAEKISPMRERELVKYFESKCQELLNSEAKNAKKAEVPKEEARVAKDVVPAGEAEHATKAEAANETKLAGEAECVNQAAAAEEAKVSSPHHAAPTPVKAKTEAVEEEFFSPLPERALILNQSGFGTADKGSPEEDKASGLGDISYAATSNEAEKKEEDLAPKVLALDAADDVESAASPRKPDPVDFLEFCLGGPAAVLEAEIEKAAEEENDQEAAAITDETNQTEGVETFMMEVNDSDEDDDDCPDLEDMFDFDPARVAELMNTGANMEELVDHLQETYATSLEQRLGTEAKATTQEETDAGNHLAMGELETLMTPEQGTPSISPKGSTVNRMSASLAEDAEEALAVAHRRTQDRSRRSLAVQHRPSAAQRGSAAMKAMEAFGRKSLAQAQCETAEEHELLQGAVQSAVRRASVRHRRSVTKAVEILEEMADAANESLDKWSDERMDEKVEVIQQAMEEAHRRHRRSISAAVHEVVSGQKTEDDTKTETATSTIVESTDDCKQTESAEPIVSKAVQEPAPQPAATKRDLAVEDRIRNAVAAAYQRECGAVSTTCHDWSDYSSYQGYHGTPYAGSTVYSSNYTGGCAYQGTYNCGSTTGHQSFDSGGCQSYDGATYYNQGHAGDWNNQCQSTGQEWYGDQQWCQSSQGYDASPKVNTWDAHSGFRQAPWRFGSG